MSTFLFDKIVFGPIKSRRLGISLGINLLPLNRKFCNFDCVYCECGWNDNSKEKSANLPSRREVHDALEAKLLEINIANERPYVLTFAGNGEPTMHPFFSQIIEDTIILRNKYFKTTQISVLSNSTMLHKPSVVEALKKVDQNIMKLDAGLLSTIKIINQPAGKYNLEKIVDQLKEFHGNLIIQTMFTRGNINGIMLDNTTEPELSAWASKISEIAPKKVMIYTVDRDTPILGLQKIPKNDLLIYAKRIESIGIEVQVSG